MRQGAKTKQMWIASVEGTDLRRACSLDLKAVGSIQLSPCVKHAEHGIGCLALQLCPRNSGDQHISKGLDLMDPTK